jgi:hypothetical protein
VERKKCRYGRKETMERKNVVRIIEKKKKKTELGTGGQME